MYAACRRRAPAPPGLYLLPMPDPFELDPAKIVETIDALRRRVHERFPGSGLERIAEQLHRLASGSGARAAAIRRPRVLLRVASGVLIAAMTGLLVYALTFARPPDGSVEAIDLVQGIEATLSGCALLGVAALFVATIEPRRKRARVLDALHELRMLAHVIDMHQLAKDPERVDVEYQPTAASPEMTLSPFELGRYLNYCGDLLSLSGKVAAFYLTSFQDAVVLAAVNEVEDLSSGLSRKIWQKLMLLDQITASGERVRAAPRPPPSGK